MLDKFGELLGNTALYNEVKFHEEDVEELHKFFTEKIKIDLFCTSCGKESTFVADYNPYSLIVTDYRDLLTGRVDEDVDFIKENFKFLRYMRLKSDMNVVTRDFMCSRNSCHHAFFTFLLNSDTIQKVGQYPSLADLDKVNLKKYKKVLNKDKMHELSKAIGLYAHGVGIGAFVYLRRIFESLIFDTYDRVKETINISDFQTKKMDEKIVCLRDYLPVFLVQNKIIYSVLSKGIHELSEEECLKIFPVVKVGIELILDEKINEYEKQEKIKATDRSLNEVYKQIKKT